LIVFGWRHNRDGWLLGDLAAIDGQRDLQYRWPGRGQFPGGALIDAGAAEIHVLSEHKLFARTA